MNLDKAVRQAYENDKASGEFKLSLADPESSYNIGFVRGVDYGIALLKLQIEEAPTLNRQDKIELSEENIKTLHY